MRRRTPAPRYGRRTSSATSRYLPTPAPAEVIEAPGACPNEAPPPQPAAAGRRVDADGGRAGPAPRPPRGVPHRGRHGLPAAVGEQPARDAGGAGVGTRPRDRV